MYTYTLRLPSGRPKFNPRHLPTSVFTIPLPTAVTRSVEVDVRQAAGPKNLSHNAYSTMIRNNVLLAIRLSITV